MFTFNKIYKTLEEAVDVYFNAELDKIRDKIQIIHISSFYISPDNTRGWIKGFQLKRKW